MACGDRLFVFQEIEWIEKLNCLQYDFAMAQSNGGGIMIEYVR